MIQGDPLDPNDKTNELVKSIRKRKGMKEEIPGIENYYDKL